MFFLRHNGLTAPRKYKTAPRMERSWPLKQPVARVDVCNEKLENPMYVIRFVDFFSSHFLSLYTTLYYLIVVL